MSSPFSYRVSDIAQPVWEVPGVSNRLREKREQLGLTLKTVAEQAGTSFQHLSRLETGKASLTVDWLDRLSDVLDCTTTELLGGDLQEAPRTVPLVGFIGAGEMYYPSPDAGPWVGFDEVEAPPSASGMVAVRIRGDWARPRYRDGDTIFFRRSDTTDAEACVGRDCIVQVKAGPVFLKRIEMQQGKLQVLSCRTGDGGGEDVEIAWAVPVLWAYFGP